ncbi:hypothetical protein [Vibrio campbellii]|uniref:hypothetical protein n=1 Tax=Vibrio campbellii TaxID=680 RepID=UPI00069479C8|nr:hypothetical protein [Vibrio campbellii]
MFEWLTQNKDLVTSFASIITALGVVFVALQARIAANQAKIAAEQLKSDHERSRRETAINVIKDWNASLDMITPSARKFVQELTYDECKKLVKLESIKVDKKHHNLLTYALSSMPNEMGKLVITNDEITLDKRQISYLLNLLISHLNDLEVALLTWMNGIADKDIIEHQFKYLVCFNEGTYILEKLREAMAGKATYPAIDSFVEYLQERNKQGQLMNKGNIA